MRLKSKLRYHSILLVLSLVTSLTAPLSLEVKGSETSAPMSTILPTKPIATDDPGDYLSTMLPVQPLTENNSPEATTAPTPSMSPVIIDPDMPTDSGTLADPGPAETPGELDSADTGTLAGLDPLDTGTLAGLDPLDTGTLAGLDPLGTGTLAGLEASSLTKTLTDVIARVVLPTTLDFYIDPMDLTGNGTLFSPEYAIINHSNVDIEFSITGLHYVFSEDGQFLSFAEPFDTRLEREENAVYMYLRQIDSTQFHFADSSPANTDKDIQNFFPDAENSEAKTQDFYLDTETQEFLASEETQDYLTATISSTLSTIASDNIGQASAVPDYIITDKNDGDPLTFVLKASNYDEDGNFVSLNQDSIFLFTLMGEASSGTSEPWKTGDMKINMVFNWETIEPEVPEEAEELEEQEELEEPEELTEDDSMSEFLEEASPDPSGSPLPDGSPVPSGSPLPGGSPVPSGSPLPDGSPVPSGSPLPDGSPVPSGSPLPESSPVPSGSPLPESSPVPSAPQATDNPVPTAMPSPSVTPVPTEEPRLAVNLAPEQTLAPTESDP